MWSRPRAWSFRNVYRRSKSRLLWIKWIDANGILRRESSGVEDPQEAQAIVDEIERQERAIAPAGRGSGMTVTRFFGEVWLPQRKLLRPYPWKVDESRLRHYFLPHFGAHALAELGTDRGEVALLDWLIALRTRPSQRDGKPLAGRTIWNAASIVRVFFADALERKKIARDPTEGWRAEKHLPPKTDKVKGWRQKAGFSLDQVVTPTTDRRVPEDRRVLYALRFLGGGLRPGEAANARRQDLDTSRQPLPRLTLASAFNTLMHEEKDTKTGAELNVPVHPVLAAALDAWRREGWERFIGRAPKTDDLIVPRQDGTQRLVTTSLAHFHTDLAAVGLPEQRQHESRSTFRNLALQAGASEFHVNLITHPKPAKAADFYTRLEMQWPAMCEAAQRIDAAAWAGRTVVESSAPANEALLDASSAAPAEEGPVLAANAPNGWAHREGTPEGQEMKNPRNWTSLQGSKLVTRTGLESEPSPVVSGTYGDSNGDGRSSTAAPDASGCVPTATDEGDGEEPPLELPAPTLERPSATPDLPPPTPELFITAGAIVADRAALGRAERWKVEEILRRAVDQAAALRGEVRP